MCDDKDKDLCDCGCDDGCDCDCDDCGEEDIMTLTLEDGTEVECAVIAVFEVGESDYIALLPLESQEEGEVYLYGYNEFDDGDFELVSIESDEEYEAVAAAFDEILDEAEVEELLDDMDEEDEE